MTTPNPRPLKIGILVPSSNTALEPLTTALLSSHPHISVHFSRFPVTEISLSPAALAQFDASTIDASSPIIAAARLLADAKVDVIGWSGTSGGWLGFGVDAELCAAVERVTGTRATTSVRGLNRVMGLVGGGEGGEGGGKGGKQGMGKGTLGLVTPYVDEVQAAIVRQYEAEAGWGVVESHLGVSENWRIADVDEETLTGQVRDVVERARRDGLVGPMVVSSFCTNLKAAHLAEKWERMFEGVIVADTVSTVVWDALRIVGREEEARQIKGWGKMFQL